MKRKLLSVALSFIIIVSIVTVSYVAISIGNITPKAEAYFACATECAIYAAYEADGNNDVWIILTDMCISKFCTD